MTKSTGKGHHARKDPARSRPTPRTPDGAIYIGLLMIGLFATGLWYLVSYDTWKHGLLGYVIALTVLVNLYAWQVCAGKRLANWQQSLARLPLRCAGYGTSKGRPLEAANGSPRAKMMLMISIATSMLLIVGLTLLLIR